MIFFTRFSSLFTALSMVFILFGCNIGDMAESDESRAAVSIVNPGFESDKTGWTTSGSVSISSDFHTGAKSIKTASTGAEAYQTISGLTPNMAHTLKAWVRGPGIIGVRNYGGTEKTVSGNPTAWTQYTVTFTTGSSNTSAVIFCRGSSSSSARFDDFTLTSDAAATATPVVTATATSTSSAVPSSTATATSVPTATSTATAAPTSSSVSDRIIVCDTVTKIQQAMQNALPGDRIVIKSGTYVGVKGSTASGSSDAYYYSSKSGTASKHIILESESASSPAVLVGAKIDDGYGIYIVGSYWEIRNLKVNTAKKGIMLDKCNYSTIYNIEVYNIAEEGIHWRDGSSNNLTDSCNIHDTGVKTPDYGEGVYVGSDLGKWDQFVKECDNITIRNCTIGPNVRAESIDIKEGCTGTIVEYCTFNGTGIAGLNYADSFMDVKGDYSIIRYNTGYQNGNSVIVNAFEVHPKQKSGDTRIWGKNNDFHHNTVYMSGTTQYLVITWTPASARVSSNTRSPAGNMYSGVITQY